MSALAVSQLLESAQTSGVDIQLDTSAVENAMLLDAIERMNLDAMTRSANKPIGKLVSELIIYVIIIMVLNVDMFTLQYHINYHIFIITILFHIYRHH